MTLGDPGYKGDPGSLKGTLQVLLYAMCVFVYICNYVCVYLPIHACVYVRTRVDTGLGPRVTQVSSALTGQLECLDILIHT